MPDTEPERHGDSFERPVDRHLSIFYRDSTLWPVLVVVVLVAATLGGSMLLLAVRERNPYSLGALALLFWISVDQIWRDLSQRRFGVASRGVLLLWVVAAGVAVLAARMQIF
jgi:hypothetical protein